MILNNSSVESDLLQIHIPWIMIKKIRFVNYKAFEEGEIKIKPITILLGANSVGKSSIVNLLLMLQQTASSNTYKSALRLHGENVSMGECENMFRNKETSLPIALEFEFESDLLKKSLKNELIEEFVESLFRFVRLPLGFLLEVEGKTQIDVEQFSYFDGEMDSEIYTSKEYFLKSLSMLASLNESMKSNSSSFVKYYLSSSMGVLNEREKLEKMYDFLKNATELLGDGPFCYYVELCYIESNRNEKVLKIKQVKIKQGKTVILGVEFAYGKNSSSYNSLCITTDLLSLKESEVLLDNKVKGEFSKLINYESTIFTWFSFVDTSRDIFLDFSEEKFSVITKMLSKIINISLSSLKSEFTSELINHISPLRAHPQRFYFLDKANVNTALDTLDGNSLTEILKEDDKVKNSVNAWLARFRLNVDVSTIQDVVHQLKIHQNALDLDITDVGFGISQILPIIVQGFLSFSGSLTMVEQPEIHLHPRMQAELADLFIDIVRKKRGGKKSVDNQKYLLIETHSEYLLKRLMRRINEKAIASDQVAVYFIEPPMQDGDSASIVEKEISKEGFFEWPKDFYEGELRLDNYNFIKQLYR